MNIKAPMSLLAAVLGLVGCAGTGTISSPPPSPSAGSAVSTVAVSGTVSSAVQMLRDIEKQMAGVTSVQASFAEEKELKILSRKVVLEGRIILENPGKLAWHVSRPIRYSMVLDGDVLRQWDADTRQVQKIAMNSNPAFQVVAQQLQGWFSGRYSELAAEYDTTVISSTPAVIIQFTPRAAVAAARFIKSVTVAFREDRRYVQAITIADSSGDVTRLTFTETVLNQPVPAGAWEVEPRD